MRPPVMARWLLRLAARPEDRSDIVADLDHEFLSQPPADARRWYWRQVCRSVGPLLRRRPARVVASMRSVRLDAVSAVRAIRHAPMFGASVVALLALGIGAFLMVFAVVDALWLRPLPFGSRSQDLVTLHTLHPTAAPDWDDVGMSYPDVVDLRQRTRAFARVEAIALRDVSFGVNTTIERLPVASVTPGVFGLIGVTPALGRGFTDADAALPGFEASVVISSALWRSALGSDPAVVGQSARINGRALTIVGVMPEGFAFPGDQQLWLPYRGDPREGRANRGLMVLAQLASGVSINAARQELLQIGDALEREYPTTNRAWRTEAIAARQFFVARRDPLPTLVGVTLVLIVVCANVGGLIVARGVGRQRELRVRASLGASRSSLVRLLTIESALLGVAGGVLGVLGAALGLRAFIAWSPEQPPYWAQPAVDGRLAVTAVALTLLVVVIVGVIPAARLSRVHGAASLAPGERHESGGYGQRRVQHWLVAGQVALSAVLLVGASLTAQSAAALLTADGGFDPAPLLSLRVYIAGDRYDDLSARGAVLNDLAARLATLPGVVAATATGSIPTDDGGAMARVRDPRAPGDASREIGVQLTPASASLWTTLNAPLLAGRTFTAGEAAAADGDVAIINARLATRLWPGTSAIGYTLTVSEPTPRTGHPSGSFATLRIVGVAPDLVYEEFGEATPQSQLMVYVPTARAPWRTHALLARVDGDPSRLAGGVRAMVQQADADFAVFDMMPMTTRRGANHWGERFMARLVSSFATMALCLACVGIYSITTHAVAQRRREIGVRLALGASPAQVTGVFLRMAGRVVTAGSLVGLCLAFVVARGLQHRLFSVSVWNLRTWVPEALLLAVAAIVAIYLPSRRASHVDPVRSLRAE